MCSQVMDIGAIGLAGRGFTTVVSPEFYKSLGDSQCISCGQCVSLCPTGALVEKVPLKKDVPLREKCTATYCTGCAAACAINVFTAGNTVTRCEPANGDVICTYGKFALVERCNADRLKVCRADGKTVSLERAAEITANRISRFSPTEIAVTVCESMTDAELQKAARLSKKLGCALINLGNLERGIDKDNYKKFEKVFGDRFSVGINREKAVSFGAVDPRAVDFQKSRRLYLSAVRFPRAALSLAPFSRLTKKATSLCRLRCLSNAVEHSAI